MMIRLLILLVVLAGVAQAQRKLISFFTMA
jgi:hypothetical protein